MQYNIHPLLVHFPIAFLLLYSVLRVLPFGRWFPRAAWGQVRLVVLAAGVLGALAATATGETAEHISRPARSIVEAHALFASVSDWLYGLLLAGELLALLRPYLAKVCPPRAAPALRALAFIEGILAGRLGGTVLALLGAAAIAVTGLLGGVMVYGLSADPVAPLVLKLLGLG